MNYIFFGTPDRARIVLQEMQAAGWLPSAIVTAPDKPIGRKQIITPSEVSQFATEHNIPTYKPGGKKELKELATELDHYQPDFLLVVAYGYLIPKDILQLPGYDAINVHYSILPRWRGASPVVHQILYGDNEVGWSIMKMVPKLDAGAVFYQETYPMPDPLPTTAELATRMSHEAGAALPNILPKIASGELPAIDQDETKATYCYKLEKTDGEINLSSDPLELYRKIKAFQPWPKTYFFVEKNNQKIRVIINDANWIDNKLEVLSVTPAGKSPMSWDQFITWLGHNPLS